MQDVNGTPIEIHASDQPIGITFDIKDRATSHQVSRRKSGTNLCKIFPICQARYTQPGFQGSCTLGMPFCEILNSLGADYPHVQMFSYCEQLIKRIDGAPILHRHYPLAQKSQIVRSEVIDIRQHRRQARCGHSEPLRERRRVLIHCRRRHQRAASRDVERIRRAERQHRI